MTALLNPQTAFYVGCALVLLVAAAVLLAVRPEFGLLATAATLAVTLNLRFSRTGEPRALNLHVGSVSVALLDVLAMTMLAVAVLRRLRRSSMQAWELLPWLLLALAGFNMVRGIRQFPLQQVVNETRPWLYLIAMVVFAALVPGTGRSRRILVGGLAVYTGWLFAVVLHGFATTGVRTVTDVAYAGDRVVDPRPVSASGALVLAMVLMLVAGFRRHLSGPVWYGLLGVLGLVVVLLQHRTVWVATAVALTYVGMRAIRRGGRARRMAIPALSTGALAAIVIATTGLLRQSALADSVSNALGQDNTLSWRILGWRQLLAGDRELTDLVVGEEFGRGFARVVNGVTLTVSAHSQYIATLLRFGLIGLVLIGLLLVRAWRNADAAGAELHISPTALRAVVILIACYGLTYSWDPVEGMALGLLASSTARRWVGAAGRGRTTTPSPKPESAGAPSTVSR